jgi:hypothetical protein
LDATRHAHQTEALAAAIEAAGDDDAVWDGLLTLDTAAPTAAIWVQPTPGKTACLWPPPPEHADADALFRAAARFADGRNFVLTQMNVAAADSFSRQRMAETGFPHLADLLYLFAEVASPARSQQIPSIIEFISHAGDRVEKLAPLVSRTYEGTLDCPALDGVRSIGTCWKAIGIRANICQPIGTSCAGKALTRAC